MKNVCTKLRSNCNHRALNAMMSILRWFIAQKINLLIFKFLFTIIKGTAILKYITDNTRTVKCGSSVRYGVDILCHLEQFRYGVDRHGVDKAPWISSWQAQYKCHMNILYVFLIKSTWRTMPKMSNSIDVL
jgi:hypothetical protein